MQIVLLDEAQSRFEAEDRWWRENRDAKELFFTEFQEILQANPNWSRRSNERADADRRQLNT